SGRSGHWEGRLHSRRTSCNFPAPPQPNFAERVGGETCFPRIGRDVTMASLERPDSLRPYELSLPRDSPAPLCGRGLGGKPVSPASLARGRELSITSRDRPDSLRPYELLLPSDSPTPLCGRGLGGTPVSPASLGRGGG